MTFKKLKSPFHHLPLIPNKPYRSNNLSLDRILRVQNEGEGGGETKFPEKKSSDKHLRGEGPPLKNFSRISQRREDRPAGIWKTNFGGREAKK